MSAPTTARAHLLLGAVVALASVVATAGFHSIFVSWTFLGVAAAGAAVALAASTLGVWRRLLLGEAVAVAVVGFVVVGIAATGGPTPSGAQTFFDGLTHSWAAVVSVTPPADLTPSLRVVPFALAWFATFVGCTIARHVRQPALPVLGPLLTTVLTVLLSAEERRVSLAQGTAVAALGLVIGVVQQRRLRRDDHAAARNNLVRRPRRRAARLLPAVAMVGLVAVAAPVLGPRLPLADAHERFDLRQQVIPPWDPLAAPSPLVEVKASLAQTRREQVVFHVDATQKLARWQVAVLGDYDGVVWTVGSGQRAESTAAEFRPVGSRLPTPPVAQAGDEPTVSASVTVQDLREPWLPTPGWPTEFSAPGSSLPTAGDGQVRANLRTGTLALTQRIPAGYRYEISARPAPQPADADLEQAKIDSLPPSAQLDSLPPSIRNLAADVVEGRPFGWEQVAAIRDTLRTTGFYDATPAVAPGHSFFRLAELLKNRAKIIGYEEQYAAAAAVLMRVAQLPTRVVVGYLIPDDAWVDGGADVHAGDIAAWVEVRVVGVGWVPVDVTPSRTRTPTPEQQQTATRDVAVPDPPPPPPPPPDVQVVTADDNNDSDPDAVALDVRATVPMVQGWGVRRIVSTGVLSLVTIAAVLAGLIVLAKQLRRRRRRRAPEPAVRIAGAWRELADRCREAHVPLPVQATPRETARAYLAAEPSAAAVDAQLESLVGTIDRAAYHPRPPADVDAERAWSSCDGVITALRGGRSVTSRLRMRLDPRTALRRDRLPSSRWTAGRPQ